MMMLMFVKKCNHQNDTAFVNLVCFRIYVSLSTYFIILCASKIPKMSCSFP